MFLPDNKVPPKIHRFGLWMRWTVHFGISAFAGFAVAFAPNPVTITLCAAAVVVSMISFTAFEQREI